MVIARRISSLFAVVCALTTGGCGDPAADGLPGANSVIATEQRDLTAPHVADSGIDVQTPIGSVNITVDRDTQEVKVAAKVVAHGETEEEAKARLQDIVVDVLRRDDGMLEVVARPAKDGMSMHGSCSFDVKVPAVRGCKVRTGNGRIEVSELAGDADIASDIGNITITGQQGNVVAQTGNGAVEITESKGDVQVSSSLGRIVVRNTSGTVKATTGNGSVEVEEAGGVVEATVSIGGVHVSQAADAVVANTGNGSLTVTHAKGTVTASASIGRINLDQVAGGVKAESGNGRITLTAAAGSNSAIDLRSSIGSVDVTLPASVGGRIRASTSIGQVTVDGPRETLSISGDDKAKQIVLGAIGPESLIESGNGSISIMLE
jgi:hypothetical protein